MKVYVDSTYVNKLIERYIKKGGEVLNTDDGILTSGDFILHDNGEKRLKCIIIKEEYVNPWTSTQTMRKYNTIPKKYQKIIDTHG